MEVTKLNFAEALPNVEKAIEKADFVAIDCEFTGLHVNRASRYGELDTPEERYCKARESAKGFGMIQFGLSTFKYVMKEKKYIHATFCFYLHGKTWDVLLYENSSLRFLSNNGFDFNKLFKYGLPYLSMAEEAERRLEFADRPLEPSSPTPVKVTDEKSKKFLVEIEAKVSEMMEDDSKDTIVLPGASLSAFHRKLIYNNIASKFGNILVRSISSENERNIEIKKFSSKEARVEFLEKERENRLNEELGFTHVVRKLLTCDKPIVGHNLILDLFHMINKTVQVLPDHLEQFKALVRSNIPTVYDTKLIAKDPPFCVDIPITALEILYNDLCEKYEPPTFEAEEGLKSYKIGGEVKMHDAGYDAFITGVSFIIMVKKLDGAVWSSRSIVKSKHLALYANRINNMNSHDVPYINIVGPDVRPDRSNIFYVECPSTWTQMHVYGLFHMIKSVKLVWINSTSLYVIPTVEMDNKTCRQHLKAIVASCPALVHVKMYSDKMPPKRKSVTDESDGVHNSPSAKRPQEFKRLKSVGSDQLSQMSLESPQEDAVPMLCEDAAQSKDKESKKKKCNASADVFSVPDDW